MEVKLIITEIRDRSVAYAFQFLERGEWGTGQGGGWGSVVAACVRFDPAKEMMTPIMIPDVVTSKISM